MSLQLNQIKESTPDDLGCNEEYINEETIPLFLSES